MAGVASRPLNNPSRPVPLPIFPPRPFSIRVPSLAIQDPLVPSRPTQATRHASSSPRWDSLLPRNWLRPRFRWIPGKTQTSFELRIHIDNQTQDLVVYTGVTSWIMPKDIWDNLRQHSADRPISVTVRGAARAGAAITGVGTAKGEITVAPVEAPGTIVYWTTGDAGKNSALKGFKMGDEGVNTVLAPKDIPESQGGCIGCHTSSPDGKYAILAMGSANYADTIAGVESGALGTAPPFLQAGGKQALMQGQRGPSSTSLAHWKEGDHVIVGSVQGELSWINLDATTLADATGVIAHQGDPPPPLFPPDRRHIVPTWSHDGNSIVYVSCQNSVDGRPIAGHLRSFGPFPTTIGAAG